MTMADDHSGANDGTQPRPSLVRLLDQIPPCPVPEYTASEKGSFANVSMRHRTPEILVRVMNTLHRKAADAGDGDNEVAVDKEALMDAIAKIDRLRHDLLRSKPLLPLPETLPDAAVWNQYLSKLNDKCEEQSRGYFDIPWLVAETYVFRAVAAATLPVVVDPFWDQKRELFGKCVPLLRRLEEETFDSQGMRKGDDDDTMRGWVKFMLWANAVDLSLYPHLATRGDDGGGSGGPNDDGDGEHESFQGVRDLGKGREGRILVDDTDKLVSWLNRTHQHEGGPSRGRRVDIILDNAGCELIADMMFADHLVRTGRATTVTFHAKAVPWFVSDATRADFEWTLSQIVRYEPRMGERFGRYYFTTQQWRVEDDPFWTLPLSYWSLPQAEVWNAVGRESDLVVFKGDLNYRKLMYDAKWGPGTSVREGMAGLLDPGGEDHERESPNLLVVRTGKAECWVGLPQEPPLPPVAGVELDDDWKTNGRWGVVHFVEGRRSITKGKVAAPMRVEAKVWAS